MVLWFAHCPSIPAPLVEQNLSPATPKTFSLINAGRWIGNAAVLFPKTVVKVSVDLSASFAMAADFCCRDSALSPLCAANWRKKKFEARGVQ